MNCCFSFEIRLLDNLLSLKLKIHFIIINHDSIRSILKIFNNDAKKQILIYQINHFVKIVQNNQFIKSNFIFI